MPTLICYLRNNILLTAISTCLKLDLFLLEHFTSALRRGYLNINRTIMSTYVLVIILHKKSWIKEERRCKLFNLRKSSSLFFCRPFIWWFRRCVAIVGGKCLCNCFLPLYFLSIKNLSVVFIEVNAMFRKSIPVVVTERSFWVRATSPTSYFTQPVTFR